MFFKSNKKYSLNDIQKLFSQIPVFFIMLLASLLLVIAFFILESKENREIDLLKQKALLNYEFNKKEELQGFKNQVKENLKDSFFEEEILLKKITYKVIGYFHSNTSNKINLLRKYIKSIENNNNIEVVVFKKDNLNILHGEDSINYLQNLIFNTKILKKNKEIILQYIYSQGEDNLQYWKDDLKKTVRLSFFDKVIIDDIE